MEPVERLRSKPLWASPVWSATETWRRLRRASTALLPQLEAWWKRNCETHQENESERHAVSAWLEQAEEVVAVEVVLLMREALFRIVRMLGFAVLAQALLLGTHVILPSQQRQLNTGVDWAYLALAIGAALYVFAQMDRQPVLCRVSSQADRTRWSWDFVVKIILYAIVPLLGLFAAYFPELGGEFFQWVERVRPPVL